jgi:hypothetical protein
VKGDPNKGLNVDVTDYVFRSRQTVKIHVAVVSAQVSAHVLISFHMTGTHVKLGFQASRLLQFYLSRAKSNHVKISNTGDDEHDRI